MIKQQNLQEILNYNPDTGLFTNKTTRSSRAIKNHIAGCATKTGYITIRVNKKEYLAHRLAWLYVYGKMPNEQIDHINHNRADNRIVNLREVTCQENLKNLSIKTKNTSGVTGVYWSKNAKRWYAQISIDKIGKHLGYFVDFHEAVNARKNAEVLYNFHENHGK